MEKLTGYEKIEKALRLDELDYVDDIVVSIRRDGDVITELLYPNYTAAGDKWEWFNDWWEGEADVQLIGARYLRDAGCFGNHLNYNAR